MGRRLLACTPLLSAMLVGCLLHPGGRAAPGDGGTDGGTRDGAHDASPPVCAGAGTPVDPLTMTPCGSGFGEGCDASGSSGLMAQGGTLTASVTMGNLGCAWNIDDGSSFHGVVVHVTKVAVAPMMGAAMLSLEGGASDTIYFQAGSDGRLMANANWGAMTSAQPVSVPFCARIHLVQGSGSGGTGVLGQVDDGSGWKTVASGSWFSSGSGQVSLGVDGMSSTATYDHFDYIPAGAP